MINLSKFFSALVGVEQVLVPIFVHNQQSQTIAAAVLVAEETLASIFAPDPALAQTTETAAANFASAAAQLQQQQALANLTNANAQAHVTQGLPIK